MRREGIISLAALSLASGYLLNSPQASLVGMALLAYYSTAKATFKPELRVVRHINGIGRVGEPIVARVEVENVSKVEGVLRLLETSKDVDAEMLEVPVKPGERLEISQRIVPKRRGKVRLKGIAVFEDGLGLFSREFSVEDRGELAVLPRPSEIASGIKAGRPTFIEETAKGLGTGMETLEFEELREFLPGDDVRRIDWKATSRLHKPVVRVYRRESFSEVSILLNLDPAFRRELRGDKIDYLTKLLSQLLQYLLRGGHSVRIVAYDRRGVVKVLGTVRSAESVLEELELLREKGLPPITPTPLSPGGRRGGGLLKAISMVRGSPFVIIIDDVGLAPKSIVEAARMIRRRGLRGIVIAPNPIYFLRKSDLNRENILTVYNAYVERKRLIKSISSLIPVVEVGPRDLLREVVARL